MPRRPCLPGDGASPHYRLRPAAPCPTYEWPRLITGGALRTCQNAQPEHLTRDSQCCAQKHPVG